MACDETHRPCGLTLKTNQGVQVFGGKVTVTSSAPAAEIDLSIRSETPAGADRSRLAQFTRNAALGWHEAHPSPQLQKPAALACGSSGRTGAPPGYAGVRRMEPKC